MDPNAETPVVASNLGDIAAALPAMFGFHPTNSIIVTCFDTTTRRLLMNMRLDMPETRVDMAQAADVIAQQINRRPAVKAILFAVTHDDRAARTMTGLIEDRIGADKVLDAARIHGDRCWDLHRPNPAEGQPLGNRPFADQLAAENSLRGQRVYNSRADMEKTFDPAPQQQRRATAEAMIDAVEEFQAIRTERGDAAAIETLRGIATNELDALIDDPTTLTPNTAAWLTLASGIEPVRDSLLKQINHRSASGQAEAWRLTATHAPGSTGASAYALAGFANWLAGDGAKALVAIDHAQGADPSHRLARMTELAVTNGLDPAKFEAISPTR